MAECLALGELLIDFTDAGFSEAGMKLFEQNPGGAPANVLSAISRLGKKTAFVGKVGRDMHGLFLKKTLEDNGIDTSGLLLDDAVFTTLAFVRLSETGEREFSFARKPGADTCLRSDELQEEAFEGLKIFHFGSLSLTDEPARQATYDAVRMAKEAGALISYDPNYRASLWLSEETAREEMRKVLPLVDLMKFSDEEMQLLTGEEAPEKALEAVKAAGVARPVLTLGSKGALLLAEDDFILVPAAKAEGVDTTGAGDAFWGGFLFSLLGAGVNREKCAVLRDDVFVKAAQVGNAAAGLCIEKRGAIPAMPTKEELVKRLWDAYHVKLRE